VTHVHTTPMINYLNLNGYEMIVDTPVELYRCVDWKRTVEQNVAK